MEKKYIPLSTKLVDLPFGNFSPDVSVPDWTLAVFLTQSPFDVFRMGCFRNTKYFYDFLVALGEHGLRFNMGPKSQAQYEKDQGWGPLTSYLHNEGILVSPSVLILKYHHATAYHHIPNGMALGRTSLALLTKWYKDPAWDFLFRPTETDEPSPKPPTFTMEQAQALPEGDVRKVAMQENLWYENALAHRKESDTFRRKVDTTTTSQDFLSAWPVLHYMGGYGWVVDKLQLVEYSTL